MGVSPEVVKDPNVRALLDRREEITIQINKLSAEYTAIGALLTENHKYKEQITKMEKKLQKKHKNKKDKGDIDNEK